MGGQEERKQREAAQAERIFTRLTSFSPHSDSSTGFDARYLHC